MPITRIRSRSATTSGGGGPPGAPPNVNWGPDFGESSDNNTFTVGASVSMPQIEFIAEGLTVGAHVQLENVDASFIGATVGVSVAHDVQADYNGPTVGCSISFEAPTIEFASNNVGASVALASMELVYSTGGTFTVTVPIGANTAKCESWGGGGAGGDDNTGNGGGGGGGGAYARTNALSVTPGNTLTILVAPSDFGDRKSFVSTTIVAPTSTAEGVLAAGGTFGATASPINHGAGGAGGTTAASIGDVKFAGGNGGGPSSGILTSGGGGGGGSGDANAGGAGGDAQASAGGTGGTGGTVGGGNGGEGGNTSPSGNVGLPLGGGGGGGSTLVNAALGAKGRCKITFSF